MTEAARRFMLRDLPLPAKLVISCFLLAVGGGYLAAMVQLHMQDARSGEPMPTVADVILKYTGKKWFASETDVPKPESKFVSLITAPEEGVTFGSNGTMSPAFTTKDDGEFNKVGRLGPGERERLLPERHGERDALVLWAQSEPNVREEAYKNDHFGIEVGKEPKAITSKFKSKDGAYKVKSIIDTRCVRCHKPNGDDPHASQKPLQSYEQIEKYLTVPAAANFRAGGDWVRVQEPIGMEKLTQSTHAHLLSFAVLFALTGLVFAFTSHYVWLRCILGPWVLIAVVVDVALWWLARLCDQWGPYFAMAIIGTGAAAGIGLGLQVTLSLLNMYGMRGKAVVVLIYVLAVLGTWQLYENKVKPGLADKKSRVSADSKPSGNANGNNGKGAGGAPSNNGGRVTRMLTVPSGAEVLKLPWANKEDGSMARSFFDKDSAEYAASRRENDTGTESKLAPLRHGEREALIAWAKLPDPERQKAYEADAFPLPSNWGTKPITTDYVKDGKVKVQALITDRCIRCHADDEKSPFSDYASLSQYLK